MLWWALCIWTHWLISYDTFCWTLVFMLLVLSNIQILILNIISLLDSAYWAFSTNNSLDTIPTISAHFAYLTIIFDCMYTDSSTLATSVLEHADSHSWSDISFISPCFGNGVYLSILINSKFDFLFLDTLLRFPIMNPLLFDIHFVD
jgi:hypothetical protein